MKTYDRVISDWSSDVCSSDLEGFGETALVDALLAQPVGAGTFEEAGVVGVIDHAAGIGIFPVDAHGNPERHGGGHRCRAPSGKGGTSTVYSSQNYDDGHLPYPPAYDNRILLLPGDPDQVNSAAAHCGISP